MSLVLKTLLNRFDDWDCLTFQSRRDDMFIDNVENLPFSPVGTICLFFYAVPTELKREGQHFSINIPSLRG